MRTLSHSALLAWKFVCFIIVCGIYCDLCVTIFSFFIIIIIYSNEKRETERRGKRARAVSEQEHQELTTKSISVYIVHNIYQRNNNKGKERERKKRANQREKTVWTLVNMAGGRSSGRVRARYATNTIPHHIPFTLRLYILLLLLRFESRHRNINGTAQ